MLFAYLGSRPGSPPDRHPFIKGQNVEMFGMLSWFVVDDAPIHSIISGRIDNDTTISVHLIKKAISYIGSYYVKLKKREK
jgi:hypothetical protein